MYRKEHRLQKKTKKGPVFSRLSDRPDFIPDTLIFCSIRKSKLLTIYGQNLYHQQFTLTNENIINQSVIQ